MIRPLLAFATVSVLLCSQTALATEVFRDNFNGSSLNLANWNVGDWTFEGNRAYFGNTPTVSGGIGHLRLDTYNPQHPGTFLGTEIYTKQLFARGTGLEFEARVRTNEMPGGLVTSFFNYIPNNNATSDEIDFNVLTKQIAASPPSGMPVVLASANDSSGAGSNPTVAGLNLHDFNTFTIRWLPDHTEWLINGALVRSSSQALPDAAMPVRLNFWAPDNSWPEAYSSGLHPTSSSSCDSYYYDVDYVSVTTISNPVPEPASIVQLAIGGLVCTQVLRSRRKRRPC